LAHLGVTRANAVVAKFARNADADLARTRAAHKDSLAVSGKTPTPTSPSSNKRNPNTPSCSNSPSIHRFSSEKRWASTRLKTPNSLPRFCSMAGKIEAKSAQARKAESCYRKKSGPYNA
jgi:hypothetical protein